MPYTIYWTDYRLERQVSGAEEWDNGLGISRRYWKISSKSWEVEAPPISGGEADGGGGFASTSKDEEEIFQYLWDMPRPLTLW